MNQRSFQLVVITHDKEFVENLGRSDFADYYLQGREVTDLVSPFQRPYQITEMCFRLKTHTFECAFLI